MLIHSWPVSPPYLALAGTTVDLVMLYMVTCPWLEAGVQANQRMPAARAEQSLLASSLSPNIMQAESKMKHRGNRMFLECYKVTFPR